MTHSPVLTSLRPPGTQASESLGMAMMFTLATFAREWLRDKAHYTAAGDVEDAAARRAAAEAEEEARRMAIRLAGTPVTAETYAAWWATFSAERQLEMASLEAATDPDKAKRLTGKRYFETRGDKAGEEDEEDDEEGDEAEDAALQGEGYTDDSDEDFDPDDIGCVSACSVPRRCGDAADSVAYGVGVTLARRSC